MKGDGSSWRSCGSRAGWLGSSGVAGEVIRGRLEAHSVVRDPCHKERDGRYEQGPSQWSPQACGTVLSEAGATPAMVPKVSFPRYVRAPADGPFC